MGWWMTRSIDLSRRTGAYRAYPDIKSVLDPLEAPFEVGQITSRIFECAGAMTPMILFRGRYANAIKPEEHYIALERDSRTSTPYWSGSTILSISRAWQTALIAGW